MATRIGRGCKRMDPISDMFIRIQNGYRAGKDSALIPYSLMKAEIARVLKSGGFIQDAEKKGKKVRKFLEINFLYRNNVPAISGIQLISRPSRRIYAGKDDLKKIQRGQGALIVSTSKGIMRDIDARKAGVGGEVIARVW